MAFNNRKLQKLIEEETKAAEFVDEFEDDFDDDFDAPEETEAVKEFAEEVSDEAPQEFEPEVTEEDAAEEIPAEETVEEVTEEPVAEETAEEEITEEPAVEAEPAVIIAEESVEAEEYDAHKMWQEMAGLAIKAKNCIKDGAFFRANDIVTVMRSMLVEMMCRANGINENFNENVDNLDDTCRQEIYTSYVATLNAETLTDVVTHIMTVTYKYI